MQEISWAFEHDTDFLQIVSDISGLGTAFWSDSYFWAGRPSPAENPSLRQRLEAASPHGRCVLFLEQEAVCWGLMRIGSYCIALGPALFNAPGGEYARQYIRDHGLPDDFPLPRTTLREISRYLSLLCCHFFGSPLNEKELVIQGHGAEHTEWRSEGDLEKYQLNQSEYDRSHMSGLEYENAVMDAVRAGDVELVRRLMTGAVPDIDGIGQMAPEVRKQTEYLIVSLLTLLTRASVEGGLRPEVAYELGDIYLNRLAVACLNGRAFQTLGMRAMLEFADRVAKARQERSELSHVEACKSYVEQNLRKDLKVGDVAPALGISRTYLAHLFKKAEGISLQQYIQREKCRHAERLLLYSDYPISLISEYLGFSSPSYFGVCFQHWYKLTPTQYRRVHARN